MMFSFIFLMDDVPTRKLDFSKGTYIFFQRLRFSRLLMNVLLDEEQTSFPNN